jgi:preprotein translocase subunit SecD
VLTVAATDWNYLRTQNMRLTDYACLMVLLLVGCDSVRNGPQPLSKAAALDVYIVSPTKTPTAKVVAQAGNKSPVYLVTPPFISAVDVESVQRSKDTNQAPSLSVKLTPAGATKMANATANAVGTQVAFLVNGTLVFMPIVREPLTGQFVITGTTDTERLFEQLTKN